MSENLKLGEIITDTQDRDAVHIAVAPVTAGELLYPGQRIGFEDGSTVRVRAYGTSLGVVDPFLMQPVERGQRFWMYLNPGSITALRHEWAHPAFVPQERKSDAVELSEAWLRTKANEWGIGYHYLMEQVADGTVCFGDDDGPDRARGEEGALRLHAGVVLAKPVPEIYFRCAC